MTFRPRLVALDIDGTIVDREGRLPDELGQAVQRVKKAGVPIVLSTGRSWHDAQPIHDALQLSAGPAIVANGAVIVDYPPLRIRRQVTFDPEPVIRKVTTIAPHLRIAVENPGGGFRLSELFPDGDLSGEMTLQTIEQLCAEPVTRVILRDPNGTSEDFKGLAKNLGMHEASYFIGWSAWLDIAPMGVNKATALKQVSAWLGVKRRHVLAIGDGRNDVEMLHWAGRGVALGDAPAEVQDVADHVTGLFDEGGTAAELNRWFPPKAEDKA